MKVLRAILQRISASLVALLLVQLPDCTAQIPPNYYDSAYGKSGYELKAALSNIIFDHTELWYGSDSPGGLWYAFRTTDVRPDGYVWDIYSNCDFIPWDDGHVAGRGECLGGTQQEHTFCQSWMNYCETPLYSDMFHMYPVDAWVNGRRNNNPYGEVPDDEDWTTRWFENGARLGYNAYVGENMTSTCGIAYEPADEYKGDIARGFLYIATCYMFADSEFAEEYEMTIRSQLRPWALDLMLKWHHQDPVSPKEINRNDLIYSEFQHNRNPFIDYPELADLIFSKDSSNTVFQLGIAKAPENLTVVPDSNGYRRATIFWTNPSMCINGTAANLTSIVIQRNGETVHTIANPMAGAELSWTDNMVPANRPYEYRVFATTAAGNGLLAAAKTYIGQYCPITVEMFDEYYDGWNGDAHIEFMDSLGNILGFSKLPCGEGWENLYEYKLPPETIHCVWIPGDNDEENSFRLYDYELETIFEAGAEEILTYNGTFYTFDNTGCPLTELPSSPDTTFADSIVCSYDFPFTWNGVIFTESGTDTATLLTTDQQDSIVVMRVIMETAELEEHRFIPEFMLPYEWNGVTFTAPGTDTVFIANPVFCDKKLTMILDVYELDYASCTRRICSAELPYSWDGELFTDEETREVVLESVTGADSVILYNLLVDTCESISDWISNSFMEIWPNPTSGILYVSVNGITPARGALKLLVYNMSGQLIACKLFSENPLQVDLASYPAGIYAIECRQKNTIVARKKIAVK